MKRNAHRSLPNPPVVHISVIYEIELLFTTHENAELRSLVFSLGATSVPRFRFVGSADMAVYEIGNKNGRHAEQNISCTRTGDNKNKALTLNWSKTIPPRAPASCLWTPATFVDQCDRSDEGENWLKISCRGP